MPRHKLRDSLKRSDDTPLLRRSLLLAAAFTFWMLVIVARLYDLQVISYVEWLARAQGQQQRTIELAPQRGTLYDREMHPLAMSLPVDSIYAVPSHMQNPDQTARLLAGSLGLEARDLEGRFEAFRSFCWVKRKVTAEESARVRALNLKGIYFQKEVKRFYPMGGLAAAVVGYVGMDDRGLAGLEYSLNSQIEGRPGHALVMEDARRRTFESRTDPGQPGMNVEMTIDAGIQYIAKRALDDAVAKWKAAGGVAVVQDPITGDILAMASSPSFDPNHYERSSPKSRKDRGISWIYEPGSTFKLITVSAALESGLARPSDVINCQMGGIVLAGHTIHDHERFGDLTVSQILAYSSDVGAIKLALRLGETRFYDAMREFGFGEKTGVALPGEERGLLMPPDRWSGISIGEMAMGQGISVTPLQLVDAYSAIANGGTLIQPQIIKRIFRGAIQVPLPPSLRRMVVSPSTAAAMRQMLEGVVLTGTGKAAQLDGYSAAGKTGTAQKVDANGRYSKRHYVASFIGFAPVSHPAVTVLVAVDTPVGGIYGAEVAAPAWKQIAQLTLDYLNVRHDQPLTSPALLMAKKHSLSMGTTAVAESPGLLGPVSAGSVVANADPASFASPPANSETVVLSAGPMVNVPDFSGLDERRVAGECQSLGLDLGMAGSGLATQQNPAPGAKVPEGSSVEVSFAR
ncbi:MAG: penicillin-binding transpeptidase domain-containing protein [Terriglobia bacterium]